MHILKLNPGKFQNIFADRQLSLSHFLQQYLVELIERPAILGLWHGDLSLINDHNENIPSLYIRLIPDIHRVFHDQKTFFVLLFDADADADADADGGDAAYSAYVYTTYAVTSADAVSAASNAAAYTATNEFMRYDLAWLLEKNSSKVGWNPTIIGRFLSQPLWQSEFSERPPEDWIEKFNYWQKLMIGLKRKDVVARYNNWLEGLIEPVEVMEKRIEEWYEIFQSENQQSVSDVDEPSVGFKSDTQKSTAGAAISHIDKPAIKDSLGRESLVDTLAEMLASPSQQLPMTLALLGDWGVGKTSFIEQLKARLDLLAEDRIYSTKQDQICEYLYANFNAWEYEKCDNLRAALAQEVVNGLLDGKRKRNLLQKLKFALYNARKEHPWGLMGTIVSLLFVIAGVVFAPDVDLMLMSPEGAVMGAGGVTAMFLLLYNIWRNARVIFVHPLANRLRTYLKLPSYDEHLGMVPVIHQQLQTLCEYRLREINNGRLLVFVDDLDRCESKTIAEVMDAIRLVMDIPKVAVVLAMDDRIAFRAIARHYRGVSGDGRSSEMVARDYMGKLIQLTINLPRPQSSELKSFINGKLFDVKTEAGVEALIKSLNVNKISLNESAENESTVNKAEVEQQVGKQMDKQIDKSGEEVKDSTDTEQSQFTISANSELPADIQNNLNAVGVNPKQEVDRELVRQSMEDSSDELQWFERLIEILGFYNPRQLIRLKNAYRFLKGVNYYTYKEQSSIDHNKAMMYSLMWCEYLYQLPVDIRRHQEVALFQILLVEVDEYKDSTEDVVSAMGREFRHVFGFKQAPLVDVYFEFIQLVLLSMMPTGHGSVFKHIDEVDNYKKSREVKETV